MSLQSQTCVARILVIVVLATTLQSSAFAAPPGAQSGRNAPLPAGSVVSLTLQDGTVLSGVVETDLPDAIVLRHIKVHRGQAPSRWLTESTTFDRASIRRLSVQSRTQTASVRKRVMHGLLATGIVIGGIALGIVAWCASGRDKCGA